jgi:HlyD family secretion protein
MEQSSIKGRTEPQPERAKIPARTPLTFRSWRWAIAGAGGLTLIAAVGAIWWLTQRAAPVHYITAPVTRGTVARTVTATGTVNPVLTIIVGSYVSGVIQEQYCDYNTQVTKGQLCAKIDPRPYQTVVDENKAALDTAKAQLLKDQANLDYAKINYAREAGLLKRKVVSQDTVDVARNALDQAVAQVALDRASVEEHQAALEAAQVNLDYTNIVSPVDGTVVSRNITIGQTVAASFQTPTLFLIATDLTKMQVDTNVSESDIGDVKEGDPASFTIEAFTDRTFRGSVVQVRQAPQTVQNVVTYDVVVGVDNADRVLKPGMTATVAIVTARRDDALRVPDQSLRYSPVGATPGANRPSQLWVLHNGKPKAVAIKTGLDDDTNTEVLAGDLKPGDQVIIGEERASAGQAARPFRFGL